VNPIESTRAALVTGGSSAIGRAIAVRLLEEGFDVTVASSDREKIAAAAVTLGRAHAMPGDVANEPDCSSSIVAAHRERFGRLDVLVNSAGILHHGPLEELALVDWDRQLAVNVTGTFLMTKHSLPLLRASQGLIVNMASMAGKTGNPGRAAYGATKAVVISLTQALNTELERDGVRAISICPGFVDTPMAGISTVHREEMIQPADVAEIIRTTLRLSPHAHIPEIVIARTRRPTPSG
jgi:NAD(P)-dependent dehydrogenase (short-subunit alcohol dehydrogenase family)